MDSNSFFIDNVKTEKAQAMMRYQRLRRTARLFRYLFEICVVFTLLFWLSTRLPLTFTFFSNYFRDISVLLKSPRFMFVVGNAIIITLFAKSGQVSGDSRPPNGNDLYDEFVKNSSKMEKIRHENVSSPVPEMEPIQKVEVAVAVAEPTEAPVPVVFEDKQMLSEKKQESNVTGKKYERSQSENSKQVEKPKKELRRSKTRKSRAEEMSNEEFNRTIEEFIAKQVRFIREESMAIVAHS